jgi:predicted kinase
MAVFCYYKTMKLIIINGAPGSGKTSVAEEVHRSMPPLSFLFKFDAQRRFLKDRHQNKQEARTLIYEVCKGVVEKCFGQGKDVMCEGVFPDAYFLNDLENIANQFHTQVYEFILHADKQTIIERSTNRPMPADALPDSKQVGDEIVEKYWNQIEVLKNERALAKQIDVKQNNLQQVVNLIIKNSSLV